MNRPRKNAIEPEYVVFGKAMKDGRNKLGYSQAEVAAIMGVTRASVAYYENAAMRMSAHMAISIAGLLGIDLNVLKSSNIQERAAGILEKQGKIKEMKANIAKMKAEYQAELRKT